MQKLLICVVCAWFFMLSLVFGAVHSAESGLAHTRSSSIVLAHDDGKIKSTKNLDAESKLAVNALFAQKFFDSYKVKNFKDLLEIESLFGLVMLLMRLSVILCIFMVIWKIINRFTIRFVASVIKNYKNPQNAQALANTAGPILNSILHWILICLAVLIVLAEIGVDIMPIIYSFSVLGLAISIGAQTLVKDFISGILTLFEGIVSVGEVVEVNGSIGTIESMSLRSIEFRHSNGKIQMISFSDVRTLINLSRDYAVCQIVVPAGHDADIQAIEQSYQEVFHDMKADKDWQDDIIGEMELKGLASITETAIYVKASIRTKPDPYDLFAQEFRKRLFCKMKEYKISLPKFASVTIEN